MFHISENNEKQFQIIAVKRVQVVNRIEHVGEEGLDDSTDSILLLVASKDVWFEA